MNDVMLEKYARLIVKMGVNIQKGQTLVVTSPIECAQFTRLVARMAYEEGARDVVVNWQDELFSKIRYLHAPEEVFDEYPGWLKELYESYSIKGAAYLRIAASDPELMKDVDPGRIAKAQKAGNTALAAYRERLMSSRNVWCVASIPTGSWARKVFPGIPGDEAVEKLWEAIFKAVRADTEDPVASWRKLKDNFSRHTEFLNSNNFKYLRFKNALGTDLEVRLPEGHVWLGGADYTPDGLEFFPNIPTEEVFTLPEKTGVNGTVVSSMPLNYNGNLIEGFSLTFRDGRVVDFKAEKGYDILKRLVETDEGSCCLGEVALVPYDSPISRLGILFFNTLFDENASCHLALGKAYPICIRNGGDMDKNTLEKLGVNDSLVHEDFMIGTRDLEITGITADGREVPVFRNGNFAL